MRLVLPLLVLSLLCPGNLLAQQTSPDWVPPGANPETGARPGNEIGTGMSLPRSAKAGHILSNRDGGLIAGRLPAPPVDENASPRDFLLAARGALAAGRTGEAQEALERAETRLLDRSVPLFKTNEQSGNALVAQVQGVLHALGADDRMAAMQQLQQAIAQAGAQ